MCSLDQENPECIVDALSMLRLSIHSPDYVIRVLGSIFISKRHLSAINTFEWGKMITVQQLYTASTHITEQ